MPATIRAVSLKDIPAMLAIYGKVVAETVITWETETPTPSEFAARIAKVQECGLPWIVAEENGEVVAYSYASRYRERHGYRFCCESTIYVREDQRGRGIGRSLYGTLMEILRRQSYAVVIAGVAVPNPESESFHRIMGFGRVGVHERIGFKFGEWHSVAFFQKVLKPHEEIEVESPIRFECLLNQGELKDLLTSPRGENPPPVT